LIGSQTKPPNGRFSVIAGWPILSDFYQTKQRMKKRLKEAYEIYLQGKIDGASLDQRLQSYLGILSHANQHALSLAVKNAYWVRNQCD